MSCRVEERREKRVCDESCTAVHYLSDRSRPKSAVGTVQTLSTGWSGSELCRDSARSQLVSNIGSLRLRRFPLKSLCRRRDHCRTGHRRAGEQAKGLGESEQLSIVEPRHNSSTAAIPPA